MKNTPLFIGLFLIFLSSSLFSQSKLNKKSTTSSISQKDQIESPKSKFDAALNQVNWRNIGPFRGGRSLAVSGNSQNPLVYYFGAVGGGVWKTEDGGQNWFCISDSSFKSSSVGAVLVAPSDQNVVYVGMGEADMRSNISFGDGMYKSTNAGATWKHIGLKEADAIATIDVHPTNPEIVFCAAVGNPFKPNKDRGVFKSIDGGQTWKKVLYKNDSTGAFHVRIDPNNPRVVYATLWQAYRNGHSMSSGGPGCGLYKSIDAGETWTPLHLNPGMPKGLLGKIGITVSPANSNRLYALIENKNGGLFTSNDAGETWSLINNNKNLWQRPWYYMNLQADPLNELSLIVLNVNAQQSLDGGKSFKTIKVGHGDTHDIWINPKDGNNYIIGDDGGGEVTFNNGKSFSDLDIPTAQFYHVNLDNDFPYHVYGAQQDNTSVRISSRSDSYQIGLRDWYPVAGGEAGYIVPHPNNSKITFGGEYDGSLTMHNADNNQTKTVSVYPESNMGHTSGEKKYRFQWTYPILFSPHNPSKLYVSSQYLHTSFDNGHTWKTISPDLTRNDPKTTGATGGPITLDQTGAEIYATVFTVAESKLEKDLIWAGSDDGLLHITKNGGDNWENVSLPSNQLGEFALMSMIHPSDYHKGKAYLAANRYMSGDKKPYMFKTTDYGKTWKPIVTGIPNDEYCRVVRDDPNMEGILYAGTERGIYISFDDGESWSKLNGNLPNTPIRDLQIQARDKDLVVATHGRSFWILDDLSPFYELKSNPKLIENKISILKPRDTYRTQAGGELSRKVNQIYTAGQNAPSGLIVNYFIKDKLDKELKLLFLNSKNDTIAGFSSTVLPNGEKEKKSEDFIENKDQNNSDLLSTNIGLNRFVWNMQYPSATKIKGEFSPIWSGGLDGPKILPGRYLIKMVYGNESVGETNVNVVMDPRVKVSEGDLKEQFDFALKVNRKLDEIHKSVNKIRAIRENLGQAQKNITDTVFLAKFKLNVKDLNKNLDDFEQALVQNKAKAFQDLLAYPIRLNDKIAGVGSVLSNSDNKPTNSSYEVYNELEGQANKVLKKIDELLKSEVPKINKLIEDQKIPALKY
jgi:photosystem II stability/assembly factor-like uncharacterized protein